MKDVAMNVMIPNDLKSEVKVESAKNNVTIRTFVINALRRELERIKSETKSRNS